MIIERYILPIMILVGSLVVIYYNMLVDGRHGFIFIDETITNRYYWYQIGERVSFMILSFVICYLTTDNLRWASILLFIYWLVDLIEFVGWYNTTPKYIHWIVFSVLLVYGFWKNDKSRVRGKGNRA